MFPSEDHYESSQQHGHTIFTEIFWCNSKQCKHKFGSRLVQKSMCYLNISQNFKHDSISLYTTLDQNFSLIRYLGSLYHTYEYVKCTNMSLTFDPPQCGRYGVHGGETRR